MLLGLQGSGKTTTSAKLGSGWRSRGASAARLDRRAAPAAIQQLSVVGKQAGVRVHDPAGEMDPVKRAAGALAEAKNGGFDVVIVDTAGRLHIDDELMDELQRHQGRGRSPSTSCSSPMR
jgi:signal recognition particle subunit SRP54